MKTILFFLVLACAAFARAEEIKFTLTTQQVAAIVSVWPALDGYDKDIDQGPGNARKVIRVNYTFTAEVRKKLAADHRAIIDAWIALGEKADALKKEIAEAVSGVGAHYDPENKKHKDEFDARAGDKFNVITLTLTPIAQDDLLNTDNPIPDSVLTAFTVLRAPVKP